MRPIPQSDQIDFLYGSMICSAIRWREQRDIIERGLDWLLALGDNGSYHIPLSLLIDVGVVLQHGFETNFDETLWPEEFRDIQLRYERFLSQILQESSVMRAMDIAQFGSRKPERLRRLIVLLMRTFAPLYPCHHVSNPAHIRRVMPSDISEMDVESHALRFTDSIDDATFFHESLREFLAKVDARVRWSQLLQSEDFFELTHWEALNTEHLRLGCRQILEVERRLGDIDTRRIEVQEEDSDTATLFEDESSYPAGGISELTHHGDFDNLVLSELVYMETRNLRDGETDEIDLFDVRFIEGELLFYQRDSGQLRRKRRTVHIIFDLDSLFHGKSIGYEYRFAMLTQGLGIRLVRDLSRVFEDDSVHAHFHYLYVEEESRFSFEQEARVMSELLADEIKHGWVTVNVTQGLITNELRELTRKTCALVMTDEPAKWNQTFAQWRRESPPIHGVVLGFADNEESELTLPLSGAEFDRIVAVRDRAVAMLAGATPTKLRA